MPNAFILTGSKNTGKTSTVHFIFDELERYYGIRCTINNLNHRLRKESHCIINVNGKKIGFASKGDSPTETAQWILELINNGCDIIVCVARTNSRNDNILAACRNTLQSYTIVEKVVTKQTVITTKPSHIDYVDKNVAHSIIKDIKIIIP